MYHAQPGKLEPNKIVAIMDDKDNKLNGPKTQKLTEKDQNLWKIATKDVIPLKGKPEKKVVEPKPTPPKARAADKNKTILDDKQTSLSNPYKNNQKNRAPEKSNETDRRTLQRLKRGQLPIEGRLDLHGMTQNQAFDALCSYIPAAYGQGKRCILVITGKGLSKTGKTHILDQMPGVLRQKTPEWLSQPPLRQFILQTHPAKQSDGGHGALYVLLRRNRKHV